MRDRDGAEELPEANQPRVRVRCPRRYRAPAILLLLAAMVVGMSAVGLGNSASAAPSASDWQRLRECESGNNYSINTGNGYYGAYQFDLSTWRSVGGSGYPHQASPATQDALALAMWQQRGWSPWVCATILGLGSNPQPDPPVGATDPIVHNGLTATVSGWAFDASNYGVSIPVHVNVNGVRNVFTADQPRPELAQFGVPGIHGFRVTVPIERGRNNEICVWAIGITSDNNTLVSCSTIGAADVPPRGAFDSVTPGVSSATVRGWVYDPNHSSTSTKADVYINGARYVIPADKPRSDVNRVFGITGNHGFVGSIPLPAGSSNVCINAAGVADGNLTFLRCLTVTAQRKPVGHLDRVTVSGLNARFTGWTFDPNASSTSNRVHIYVNGVGRSFAANRTRDDVNRVYSISGQHGFSEVVPLTPGDNQVCVYGIGSPAGNNQLLACRTVQASAPVGARVAAAAPEESAAAGLSADAPSNTLSSSAASGLAPSTTLMETLVASSAAGGSAAPHTTVPNTTVPTTTVPTTTVPTTAETTVTETGPTPTPSTTAPLDTGGATGTTSADPTTSTPAAQTTGAPPSTVSSTPTAPPVSRGAFDALVVAGNTGTLTGWVADPGAAATGKWVRITVNGITHDVLAGTGRSDVTDTEGVAALGFSDTVTLAPGDNEVCLYDIDGGGGISTAPVVCRTEVGS